MLGLRRLLAGKKVAEIKAMAAGTFETEAITLADFETVFATVKSSAGKNDLEKYKSWFEEYGSAVRHTQAHTEPQRDQCSSMAHAQGHRWWLTQDFAVFWCSTCSDLKADTQSIRFSAKTSQQHQPP